MYHVVATKFYQKLDTDCSGDYTGQLIEILDADSAVVGRIELADGYHEDRTYVEGLIDGLGFMRGGVTVERKEGNDSV